MAVWIVIPSRFGSERFPGKPLVNIHGRPMIQHVYEQSKLVKGVERVIVATDDERIEKTVLSFGGEVVRTDSYYLSGTDRCAAVCRLLKVADDDIVINVQGDQPAIHPILISGVIQQLNIDPCLLMVTAVTQIIEENDLLNSNVVKVVINQEGFAIYFSRSMIPWMKEINRTKSVYKHVGIYAFRSFFLKNIAAMPASRLEVLEEIEVLRVIEAGYRVKVVITDLDSPDVNEISDLAKVEAFMGGYGNFMKASQSFWKSWA